MIANPGQKHNKQAFIISLGMCYNIINFMSIFFKNNQEQQSYFDAKLKRDYPKFKTGGFFYRYYINKFLTTDSIVLDAGCGDGGIIRDFKNKPKIIIGVDVNEKLLAQNNIVDQKIISNLENIPLDNNTVDIIVSEFVLEHLAHPEAVFEELARVLKPDGVFIFITPNVLNPIMALSRILPHTVHKFFRTTILKKEEETHPTYYRANTYKTLIKLGISTGLSEQAISRAGNPEYLGFCKPLAPLAIWLEKMIDNKYLDFFKMYLIGSLVKK